MELIVENLVDGVILIGSVFLAFGFSYIIAVIGAGIIERVIKSEVSLRGFGGFVLSWAVGIIFMLMVLACIFLAGLFI